MRRFNQSPIGIGIHHSATSDGKHLDTDGIRYFHMHPALNGTTISHDEYLHHRLAKTPGLKAPWDEIGYHRLIERVDGRVQVIAGRSFEFEGAHEPQLNATHLGLCIIGNFDLASPDNELLDTAAEECLRLMNTFQIRLKNVVYHCDYSTKTCPGVHFPKGGFLLQLAGEARP